MRETQAIIQAAGNGELETIQSLINEGVDLNAPNDHGEIALIRAASQGQVEALVMLLDGGADVNATSGEGMTALIRASLVGQSEAVKVLLAHGADRQPKDRFGSTALDWALAKGHDEIVALLTGNKTDHAHSPVNQPIATVGAGNTLSTLYAQNLDPIQLIKPVRTEQPQFALAEPASFNGDQSRTASVDKPSPSKYRARTNKWYAAVSVVILVFISGAVVAALNYRARRSPVTVNQPVNNSLAIPVQPLPAQPATQPTTAPVVEVRPTPQTTVAPTIAVELVKPSPVISAAQPSRAARRDSYPMATSMRRSSSTALGSDAVLIDGSETAPTRPTKIEEPTPAPTQTPQRITPIRDTRIYRTQPMATPLPSSNLPDTRKKKVIQWP